MAAPAVDLEHMSVAEKLRLLEAVWQSLRQRPEAVPSPDWHREELEAREARLQDGTSRFVPWEEAKKRLRDELG